jgi:kinesin family protein 3/17
MMNSQMLIGGTKIEDTPQFRNALEEKKSKLKQEFDEKLKEIEKERQQAEEEKAQIEKYKQLLLKQRDIMIALTNKLNERDEIIVQLQEEIDAYDKINKEQEELLDGRMERINQLESILRRNNITFPEDIMNIAMNATTRKNEKIYIPYESEKNSDNSPVSLLTADEKIKELNFLLKEQEVSNLIKYYYTIERS